MNPADPTEAQVVDELAYRALWSRAEAETIRARDPRWALGGAALRPALAALIHDHDAHRPDAPARGPARAASIWDWIETRAAQVDARRAARQSWALNGRRGPQPAGPAREVRDGLYARAEGRPDPGLLAHAPAVLTALPAIIAPDAHQEGSTARLLHTLGRLRDADLAAQLEVLA
ncbi:MULTISPECIES: hypothetical protein [unclassified Cellulomonas]|uniref:hypothetical protein n=1 Tax=unclassified Cellulomonas TaxID=2620175 RepID=UPI001C4F19D9|nr:MULTISPECIES: hypothetical protein [unclassified Cellulomonas]MBW0254421.1 hypothetical protein [Cellulomonas sp. PS-H5]MCG7284649.1 hypothetical protein [Cellulomonas sp. ACRRI]